MISVIIPIYNSEKYLGKMLEGVLRQNYVGLEIILVNDGSSDDSEAIALTYQKKDARIQYIKTKHRGVSAARNIGLEKATGDYVRFLDADDKINVTSMEKMLMPMESDKQIDLLCGAFDTNSKRIQYFCPAKLNGKTSIEDFIKDFGSMPGTFYYGVTWNKLYKREIIEQYHCRFDERFEWCEDFLFNLQYYKHCRYVYCLHDSIYSYLIRDEGTNNNLSEIIGEDRIAKINQYRYKKALALIRDFGCISDVAKDELLFIELKYKLDGAASAFSGKDKSFRKLRDWRKRYYQFCRILSSEDSVMLLRCRKENDPDRLVKIMYHLMRKKRFLTLFVIMVGKDFMSVHCKILKKVWNKRKRKQDIL